MHFTTNNCSNQMSPIDKRRRMNCRWWLTRRASPIMDRHKNLHKTIAARAALPWKKWWRQATLQIGRAASLSLSPQLSSDGLTFMLSVSCIVSGTRMPWLQVFVLLGWAQQPPLHCVGWRSSAASRLWLVPLRAHQFSMRSAAGGKSAKPTKILLALLPLLLLSVHIAAEESSPTSTAPQTLTRQRGPHLPRATRIALRDSWLPGARGAAQELLSSSGWRKQVIHCSPWMPLRAGKWQLQ